MEQAHRQSNLTLRKSTRKALFPLNLELSECTEDSFGHDTTRPYSYSIIPQVRAQIVVHNAREVASAYTFGCVSTSGTGPQNDRKPCFTNWKDNISLGSVGSVTQEVIPNEGEASLPCRFPRVLNSSFGLLILGTCDLESPGLSKLSHRRP